MKQYEENNIKKYRENIKKYDGTCEKYEGIF